MPSKVNVKQFKFKHKKLDNVIKALGIKQHVRVGIFGSPRSGAGINNASVGLKHELGSLSENIPPRSFIRMPLTEKGNAIFKRLNPQEVERGLVNGKLFLEKIGVIAEEYIQQAFDTGGFGKWAPVKESTSAKKGSSSILIDTGQLRRSITSEVK